MNDEDELERNDDFINNVNSTLFIKKDYDEKEFNYEWLDIIEDVNPYIDNILRNPKRFIINEEEVVKVELAKRVTVESVIHLSQHTSLIQKIEDNGDVKPSKILNINREESLDTYENRFIFTLINNLMIFYDQRTKEVGSHSYCNNKANLKYEANSKIGNENVVISLSIDDQAKEDKQSSGSRNGMTYEQRLKKVKRQIDGFQCSELYTTLNRLHVSPVRSPIKKTNVILKNPNFRKAEELWNYIQSFESKDKRKKENREFFDKGILKEEYDQAFLMAFIANKNFISTSSSSTEMGVIQQMSQRLIENLLETDPDLTEEKLDEVFHKQIVYMKDKNEKRRKRIYSIIKKRLDKNNKALNTLLNTMRKKAPNEESV